MTTGRGQTTCLTRGKLRGFTSRWGGTSNHLDTMGIPTRVPNIFTNPMRPAALPAVVSAPRGELSARFTDEETEVW